MIKPGDIVSLCENKLQKSFRFDSWSLSDKDIEQLSEYGRYRINTKETDDDDLYIVILTFKVSVIILGANFLSRPTTLAVIYSQNTQKYYEAYDFEIEIIR